ncbi:efflux RND transporter periplasmic adaptor subunit [Marinihelvus fidelis]|uniref:Efflux RND transporter periplasmic adaptor subunit n=1 Tax=Marinihelvus fidelis TaxID=2613842 RepID=A0A5N0TD75_9GAMM|nr:efflux RND transporter periplasmic adaptor subunit [Marinihelvus fidelis]KAA9132701.1 efflux RND transporter periplasmic adaptor subunit [Marinihelvus fidelis]
MNSEAAPDKRRPGLPRTLIVCALIAVIGIVLLTLIFNTEPGAERETAVRQSAVMVDIVSPEAGDFQPVIQALGSVRPSQEIELRSRVFGEVTAISDRLAPGGFVSAGDVLLRIQDADYRNTLLQRQSELQQAIAELEQEKGRQIQAEREYRDLKADRGEALDPANLSLILRQPQLQSAEARVNAARAAAAQAQLDLERTVIRAPFDALVLERAVNLGSQVSTGEALAHLVGLERYWVEATVPLDKLRWLAFANGEPGAGSAVTVHHRSAWPEGQYRRGYLDQLVGQLEGGTRLARVLVVVEDPLARAAANADQPGLIIGAFMDTRISGRQISGALKLPRELVRQGDTVWLMRDGVLAIQPVVIQFEDASYAYISEGLQASDQVVATNLATVKEGLRLRPREAGAGP